MGLGRLRDGLAPTPPMGWNSWNHFGKDIDERLILETAEAMVETGMRELGYRYVVIDDGWMAPARDAAGELVADPDRFPSGIARVAERVHALGLRLGIYTDAGTATCEGLPGSRGHEAGDAMRFASWGADYLKVDWCHTEGMEARPTYENWCAALRATGRPMVVSICEWGRARPWEWAGTVGHLWRTGPDITPTWESIVAIVERNAELHPHAGPSHWNDPDMLEVGNGSLGDAENRAHFGLWAMLAAPLIAGNDLREMAPSTREILTAPEVIAVDQDQLGRQGRRLLRDGHVEVWVKDLWGGALAVALCNGGDGPREVALSWHDIGWRGSVQVRDLWRRIEIGTNSEGFSATVGPRDLVMVRLRRAR